MRFILRRVRLNAGGYEFGKYGRYFGIGAPLYHFENVEDDVEIMSEVRGSTRDEAKKEVEKYARRYTCDPNLKVTFYR